MNIDCHRGRGADEPLASVRGAWAGLAKSLPSGDISAADGAAEAGRVRGWMSRGFGPRPALRDSWMETEMRSDRSSADCSSRSSARSSWRA